MLLLCENGILTLISVDSRQTAVDSSEVEVAQRDRKMLPAAVDSSVFRGRRFADEIATLIRQLILSRHFEQGERLNEVSLAEMLAISRSPIREALQILAGEGLVRAIPGRGMFVTTFDAETVDQLTEVRQSLESTAARLAALRGTAEQFDALERLLERTADCLADSRGYPRDLDFHQQILDMCGNPKLVEAARVISTQFQLARARSGESPGRAEVAFEEHLRICAAVRARDPEAAAAAMFAHLEASRRNVRNLLDGKPSESADQKSRNSA